MLSYRHSFHAGNHADVLKHTVQSLIIESLKEKRSRSVPGYPLGAGRYQLSGEHAESAPANTWKASACCGNATICRKSWRPTWRRGA